MTGVQTCALPIFVLVETSQHDTCVLASELVGRLAHVQRDVASALPELEEEGSDAVRDAEVVELLGLAFGKVLEERGHLGGVADSDLVGLQGVGLVYNA